MSFSRIELAGIGKDKALHVDHMVAKKPCTPCFSGWTADIRDLVIRLLLV